MSSQEIDIIGLAAHAKSLGFDSPERIVKRIEQIIARNKVYVSRPYRQGRSFNTTVEEDNAVLAAAIVLLESLSS